MLHIVDDEEAIRDSLIWLAQSRRIEATGYDGVQPFLDMLGADYAFSPEGDCLLLDMRMPIMSGALLFDTLAARGLTRRMPVIFLTGHGDVPMAVDSLKRGAFDFFEKPFNDNKLMDRVQEALRASLEAGHQALVETRLASLSSREREVMDLILEGLMNKVIADRMGITMRTVEVHRSNLFTKMGVRTAVELARLVK
ncbi:response regulator transcription factor [Castellaniella denitrificans]|uniref:LuxR C-terminal-related transcriptional regulator n=1 Tax=Castellaniella denitrificans TaxID=56119 RepID=A0ABT4M7B8_9BURK|nr:LuxR C-terminal-related transcriptional regulator [Castellaniella denitrificans]MCZ4331224.1 LuxR C-terminal-related transcriptional regulator [Castellaniella denitrificans]